MAVDSGTFKELFGSFPAAVSVVTTLGLEGEPRGLTCTAVSAVSAEPPLLLVCVDKGSRTLPALLGHRAFVLNILAEGADWVSQQFATGVGPKFAGLGWHASAAAHGAPVLHEVASAVAECTLDDTVEAGDHVILIGRIQEAAVQGRRPLLYQRGRYGTWTAPERELAVTGSAATPR
ncbi:flavin reductase family protein [Streptacidiphilus jiangxiensis]|uniref:NADH-FMN oxidoreductase RutF, flavin reductase (DIM6/NTAB) family n=1 Tax=Streptacidiphilus jiangxiensis TaxID=235985 RepID=A0A1H7JPI7_STRJI|nr:flavin reductase family protein [Streptacidiphilus jiangxiensis]SEK75850.1 NADH-FMN oxidoreductase RutF, flavin reductase (DIM6/NTAB) family [Streptacidiphilus jiangxiensis]